MASAHLYWSLVEVPAAGPASALLGTALLGATITDLRSRRIPNWLTFEAALGAFVLHGVYGGGWVLLSSVAAFFLWFAIGLFIYSLTCGEGFGAGDTKMVMATGAAIGFWPALWMYFVSNLLMALLYLPLRWIVQGTLLQNGRLLGRWLLGNLVAIAGRIGLGQRGAHFVHFEPVGMKDNTPHAPFMLLGLGCTYALIYYGVL